MQLTVSPAGHSGRVLRGGMLARGAAVVAVVVVVVAEVVVVSPLQE